MDSPCCDLPAGLMFIPGEDIFLSDSWYGIKLFLFAIFDDDFFYSCFLWFTFSDQADDLVPWKTMGISPMGNIIDFFHGPMG